jgi:hypothetical protein
LPNRFDLIWVQLDSISSYDEAKELQVHSVELAFLRLNLEVPLEEFGESLVHVLDMFLECSSGVH